MQVFFVALKIFMNFSFGTLAHFISDLDKMNHLLVLNEMIFLLTEVHPSTSKYIQVHPHDEMISLAG